MAQTAKKKKKIQVFFTAIRIKVPKNESRDSHMTLCTGTSPTCDKMKLGRQRDLNTYHCHPSTKSFELLVLQRCLALNLALSFGWNL